MSLSKSISVLRFFGSELSSHCRSKPSKRLCLHRKQLLLQKEQNYNTSTSSKPSTTSDEFLNAKPFSSIPGPTGLPFIGNISDLPIFKQREKIYEKVIGDFAKYGPIFKVTIGPFSMINLCDVDAIEKLHRNEGKYPTRIVIEAWRHWRDEQKLSRGILTEDGSEWKRMRAIVDKQMLRPQHVATYAEKFNEVVTDLIERLNFIRKTEGGGLYVPNIDHELFHWSLETVGTVLYETRFGGLSNQRDQENAKFIKAVQNMFLSTEYVAYFPVKFNRIFFRKWQKMHEQSWDVMFQTTKKLIDKKFAEIQKKVENGEETSGFLAYLLTTDMSREEVYGNIADIMVGAVDTTSNTMQWVLYELSRQPDIQERLHLEVTSIAPAGTFPTYESLQKMPLLKAIIKEILRLYPVAVTARVLHEDLVLYGYQIPAGTTVIGSTFAMGRDPKHFKDSLSFRPDRWIRNENAEAIHSFAWLPFGFGPRSCIGRRVAELEMYLLLARISQLFKLEPGDEKPLNPTLRGLLVPERPVNVRFIDRKP